MSSSLLSSPPWKTSLCLPRRTIGEIFLPSSAAKWRFTRRTSPADSTASKFLIVEKKGVIYIYIYIYIFNLSVIPNQEGKNGDIAALRNQSQVLHQTEEVRRIPVGDRSICLLSVSTWMGTMESEIGRISYSGMRSGDHCRWNPTSVPDRSSMGEHLPHRRGE